MERPNKGGFLYMKRLRVLMALMMISVFGLSAASATVTSIPFSHIRDAPYLQITPYYSYTDNISASLSFSGSTADCYGTVSPSGNDSVSITVTLYKQSGSKWNSIDSWTGSSTGGSTAAAGGTATVSAGTYKVVVVGNVGGKEYPTKSVTRTN